jgi:non-ribosomal peptide synthetase component F
MSKHVPGEKLSIGKPTPNNAVYILDSELERTDYGVGGSMWAGGHGVSRGYVGLEAKTKESYLLDKFANDGYVPGRNM